MEMWFSPTGYGNLSAGNVPDQDATPSVVVEYGTGHDE